MKTLPTALAADRAQLAAWLRYAVVKMAIRHGASAQNAAHAIADGRMDAYERHLRDERRRFAAIKRLADAFEALARGAR